MSSMLSFAEGGDGAHFEDWTTKEAVSALMPKEDNHEGSPPPQFWLCTATLPAEVTH